MKITSVSIPSGLEDAFYNALTLLPRGSEFVLRSHNVLLPSQRYLRLGYTKIYRILSAGYKNLNNDRRVAWRDYGRAFSMSGRSAYFAFNAKRAEQGVDIFNFPPIYPGNEVSNFDMFGNPPRDWTGGPAGIFYGNGHVSVPAGTYGSDTLICFQELYLLPSTTYEIGFEFYTYSTPGDTIKFGLGSDLFSWSISVGIFRNTRVSHSFTTPSGFGFLRTRVVFYARGTVDVCYINNVSVIKQ